MNKELKIMLNEHYDKVVGLLKKAGEMNKTPYKSGVVDGAEHAIPSAFLAGARAFKKLAVKPIAECFQPDVILFAVSEVERKAIWMRVNDKGEAYDMNGNLVFPDEYDYCLDFNILFGKEVTE